MSTERETKAAASSFAEVWYDVVSPRHLLISVVMGLVLGLVSYVGGRHVLAASFPGLRSELVGGYALFLGVGGSVFAGVLAGLWFKPKRVLVESTTNETQILDLVHEEGMSADEEIAALENLPERVKQELQEVGAYDMLLRALRSGHARANRQGDD